MGRSVSYGEAIRLVRVLRNDPGTQLAASVEKWAHPTDRSTAVMMDLFDLEHAKAGVKNPKPYPRAWKAKRAGEKIGDRAGRTPAQVMELLRPTA